MIDGNQLRYITLRVVFITVFIILVFFLNKFNYIFRVMLLIKSYKGVIVMCKITPHFRCAHMVRGHFRNTRYGRIWIGPHERAATVVNDHCIWA